MERTRRTLSLLALALLVLPCTLAGAETLAPALAGSFVIDGNAAPEVAAVDPCVLSPDEAAPTALAEPSLAASAAAAGAAPSAEGQAPARRPLAFEYSDGYQKRLKIHKYASYATVPLFVAQTIVGQQLYDGNGGSRSAHTALAVGTGVLFGVNTVTGVWNLVEGWKDPNRKTKTKLHSILMLVADVGFVATGALAPDDEFEFREGGGVSGGGVSRSTHRTIALSSMGLATLSYLIMLIH